jgi:hypothetical protein
MIKRFSTVTAILTSAVVIAAGGVALAQGANDGTREAQCPVGRPEHPHAALSHASAGNEQSSEVQGNDGPGGHADEAGAEVDHQFEGQE